LLKGQLNYPLWLATCTHLFDDDHADAMAALGAMGNLTP
jgi:hypothetical protein